jgi:metal-responsive CopG/Arc/MetJ family transcriptional regulator
MHHRPAVIPGYTHFMKTAISVPDDIFADATKRASELGISRSEFFSTAVRRYLDQLSRESLTAQINQVLDLPDYDDEAAVVAVEAGRRRLSEADW